MPLKRLSPPLVAILACGALAACGSSSSSSSSATAKVTAASYVKALCSSIGPFERDVVTRSSALNLTSVKSPAEGKTALKTFLTAISGDTDTAVSKLNAAGTPNVSDGQHISSAILSAFRQLQSAMHTATTQADALSTQSATAFKNGAESLGKTVRDSMSRIGQNLQASTLKSTDLQKAAQKEPSCKSVS
jgi:hypothetical protein